MTSVLLRRPPYLTPFFVSRQRLWQKKLGTVSIAMGPLTRKLELTTVSSSRSCSCFVTRHPTRRRNWGFKNPQEEGVAKPVH
jgi:hypothetical protein